MYLLLYGTDCSATLTVTGDGFQAYGVTVANTFDRTTDPADAARGPQAVAVKAVADKVIFAHDDFTGVQDTVFASSYADNFQPQECFAESGVAHPPATSPPAPATPPRERQVYVDDTISGSIDLICGSATAVFDHDDIDIVGGHPGGSVTAPDTPTAFDRGYLIINSRIDNEDGTLPAAADFLSRPWRHTGTTNPVVQMTDPRHLPRRRDQPRPRCRALRTDRQAGRRGAAARRRPACRPAAAGRGTSRRTRAVSCGPSARSRVQSKPSDRRRCPARPQRVPHRTVNL